MQRYARQIGEDDEVIGDMGFALSVGPVGARVLFIVNWSTYAADPLKIFKIWEGGSSFTAALSAPFVISSGRSNGTK